MWSCDGRRPSDAHHIQFGQTRALGRKVSDEYTVPLCRVRHRDLQQRRPARQSSAALPVHELRSAMMSRTQAATGSASIMHSIAALRFALGGRCRLARGRFRRPLPRSRNQPSVAGDAPICRLNVCWDAIAHFERLSGTLGATLIVSSRSPWRFCRGLLSRQPSALTRWQAQRSALQLLC
jgi:hypothetical protein